MLRVTEAPTSRPVSLDEAKAHLKVLHDEFDAEIELYLDAAITYAEGTCQQTLAPTVFLQTECGWPCGRPWGFTLETGPVRDVLAVEYTDSDGNGQTLDPDHWDWERTSGGAVVWLTPTFSSPSLADVPSPVRIAFEAGFNDPEADDADPALAAPKVVKAAVLLMVGHLYKNREAVGASALASVPHTFVDLLAQVRVFR